VAAVDGTAAQAVSQRLGVKGFPTIFVYGADKAKPTTYNGGRDAKAIVDAALREVSAVAQRRLSGKSAPGGGGSAGKGGAGGGGGGAKKGGNKASDNEPGGGKHVLTLSDDDFEDTVLNSDDAWMVEFYAPW
jgi:protein disulfide-isomerase A6